MPESNQYTQYNANVQAVMTQHTLQYMGWYDAAVVLYALAIAAFVVYWFFRSRGVVGLALLLTVAATLILGIVPGRILANARAGASTLANPPASQAETANR